MENMQLHAFRGSIVRDSICSIPAQTAKLLRAELLKSLFRAIADGLWAVAARACVGLHNTPHHRYPERNYSDISCAEAHRETQLGASGRDIVGSVVQENANQLGCGNSDFVALNDMTSWVTLLQLSTSRWRTMGCMIADISNMSCGCTQHACMCVLRQRWASRAAPDTRNSGQEYVQIPFAVPVAP